MQAARAVDGQGVTPGAGQFEHRPTAGPRARWWIDTGGSLHRSPPSAVGSLLSVPLASGWVEPGARIGAVEQIRGEAATPDTLPAGVLDELEARYPSARWFIGRVPVTAG
jgi:hypothetical protein